MRFFATVAAFASVAAVFAENFTVIVGQDGGLTYTPSTVTAQVGDVIAFQFVAKNHTVTQSTFAKPCEIMTTPTAGIDSGFFPVAPGATSFPQWSFTVNNVSAPLWFYCRQTPHCSKGMVFAVNPTADKTFDAFKATAMGSTGSSSGAGSATSSGAGAPSAAPTSSGASPLHRNTAGFLAIVGLIAGLLV